MKVNLEEKEFLLRAGRSKCMRLRQDPGIYPRRDFKLLSVINNRDATHLTSFLVASYCFVFYV